MILLTDNNNKYVKGTSVFNGKQSRVCTTKEETASPTTANGIIMITVNIDAKEGRDVMRVDVLNTFIQTKITHKEKGERVIMKITSALVDMLLKLDPDKFKGYAVYENRLKVTSVVVLREIHGILVKYLICYQKVKKNLESIGFVFNNYDPFVANMMVNEK